MGRHCKVRKSLSFITVSLAIMTCVAISLSAFLCYSYYTAIQDITKRTHSDLTKMLVAEYNVGIKKYAYESLRQERKKALETIVTEYMSVYQNDNQSHMFMNMTYKLMSVRDYVNRYVRLHKLRDRINVYGYIGNISYLEIFAVSEAVFNEAMFDEEYILVRQKLFASVKHITDKLNISDSIICESYSYLVYSVARMRELLSQYKSPLVASKHKITVLCDSITAVITNVFMPYCDILLSLDAQLYDQYEGVLYIPSEEVEDIIGAKYPYVPVCTHKDTDSDIRDGFFIVDENDWSRKVSFLYTHLQNEYGALDLYTKGVDTVFNMLRSRQNIDKQ